MDTVCKPRKLDQRIYQVFGEPLPNLRPKTRPLEIEIIRHFIYLRKALQVSKQKEPKSVTIRALRKAVIDNWPTENAKFKHDGFKVRLDHCILSLIRKFESARESVGKRLKCMFDSSFKTEKRMEFSNFFRDIETIEDGDLSNKEKTEDLSKKEKAGDVDEIIFEDPIISTVRRRKPPKKFAIEGLEQVCLIHFLRRVDREEVHRNVPWKIA